MKRLFLVLLLAATPVPAPATAQTASSEQANTVETGAINGAPFYIEIPKQWNKGLVLYTHGYSRRRSAALPPPTFCTFPREFSSFGRQGL